MAQEKTNVWMQVYRVYDTLCSTLLIPVAIWSFHVYTNFVILQADHDNLKKEMIDVKLQASEKISAEKLDRIADVQSVRGDLRDFRSEYNSDFPKNYRSK